MSNNSINPTTKAAVKIGTTSAAIVAVATAGVVATKQIVFPIIIRNKLREKVETIGREVNMTLSQLIDLWNDYDIDNENFYNGNFDEESKRIADNLGITVDEFCDRQCAYTTLIGIMSNLQMDYNLAMSRRSMRNVDRILKFRRELNYDQNYAHAFILTWSDVMDVLNDMPEDAISNPCSFIEYIKNSVPDFI